MLQQKTIGYYSVRLIYYCCIRVPLLAYLLAALEIFSKFYWYEIHEFGKYPAF